MDIDQPEPWRSPLPYDTPIVTTIPTLSSPEAEVQVAMLNEDPDTEDDLTLNVKFTGEGIIVDLFVSDGEPVATFGQTYEEFVGTVHRLDPMTRPPVDSATQRVAALSADLRDLLSDRNEFSDSVTEYEVTVDLLDAIDAMLSEAGR